MDLSLEISLARLEIVAGKDGFLRGNPDPALVVAAYVVVDRAVSLLDRGLVRFEPKAPFPSSCTPKDPSRLGARLAVDRSRAEFLILVVAFEENGGTDVRRMYGAVEHPHELAVWAPSRSDVTPVALTDLGAADYPLSQPVAVNVEIDGASASSTRRDDTLVGAALCRVVPRVPPGGSIFRLPLRAPDRQNDWTAFLEATY